MNRVAIAAGFVFLPLTALGAIKAEPMSDLRPPRPQLPAPTIERNRQEWVLGGVAAGLILALLCWPRRKPPSPPPDPHTIAQQELDALAADPAKATPVSVSAIVRRYAVDAFGLAGNGLTSEEVVSGLATRRSCPADLVNAAWHFLSDCDRAKFAPTTEPTEGQALLGAATSLLDQLEGARAAVARAVTV
jgi:hypothetical protein